jgi:licheninase
MNIAVGGTWGGAEGIDDSAFPERMVIDYVRVYKPE